MQWALYTDNRGYQGRLIYLDKWDLHVMESETVRQTFKIIKNN